MGQSSIEDDKFVKYTLFASALAGMCSKFVTHPLDTLKTKLQVQTIRLDFSDFKNKPMLRNITIQTIKNEGIRGLYSGVGISVLGTGPAFTLFMTSYEYNKSKLIKYEIFKKNDFLMYMAAGFSAEIISCLIWLPIDVIKERLQVQQNLELYKYKNSIDAIQQISKQEGITGLYRAYGATVCSFGPFSAFYFTFYEFLKSYICDDKKNPKFIESFILAALAGSASSIITNPLEVSKIRMQVQRSSKTFYKYNETQSDQQEQKKGNFGYKNMVHGIIQIVKKEGFASLFKGVSARLLLNAPQSAISMSLTEKFRTFLINSFEGSKH